MIKKLKNGFLRLFSYIKPVPLDTVITNGEDDGISLAGMSREQIREIGKRDKHLTRYKPWPESYFVLVGIIINPNKDDVENPTLYRFFDPVSQKDFLLPEKLVNILFYHQPR